MSAVQQHKLIDGAPLEQCPKFVNYLMQIAEASNLQLNAHCIKMPNMKLPQFFSLYFCMRFNNNLLFGKQIINQSFFFRYVQKTV